jgi:hypothetical protein
MVDATGENPAAFAPSKLHKSANFTGTTAMMMKKLLALGVVYCSFLPLQAQQLSSISTRWNDSFVAWEIFTQIPRDTSEVADEEETPEEERNGEIKQRWLNVRDDWSEWDYQFRDEQGTIKVKWKDNPREWELRSYDGHIITMRTAWSNDFSEWRITDNGVSLILKSRWTSQFDEWLVDDPKRGRFYMYTLRQGDPRDWAIEDNLDASVSESMKLALVFITIFNTSPRQ